MCSFILLLGIVVLTVYCALMYNNEAMMVLVFMETAFFVLSFVYIVIQIYSLKAKLCIPVKMIEVGKNNRINIMIRRSRFSFATRMKAYVSMEHSVTKKKRKIRIRLEQSSLRENVWNHSVLFREPGEYEIVFKKLKIYDITGLMYGTVKINSSDNLQVLPRIFDMTVRLTAAVKNFYGETDVYDTQWPGYDFGEIFQVRPYREGDRLQMVHWKMTAKQDEFMVKDPSLPKACPVVLVLNYHNEKCTKKERRISCFMEMTLSLSFSMMKAGCLHYVAWYHKSKEELVRVRVEDETGMYELIRFIMEREWEKDNEYTVEQYKEKYRTEQYVWMLTLNEKLQLKKSGELIMEIQEEQFEREMLRMELVL